MNDFTPPPPSKSEQVSGLFLASPRAVVQTPAQSHEYKKCSGSSDAAHTYDTNRR
ncbi:hypothetical protein NGM33_01395 [Nocardiopsis dassonvillei]|uniref:hypothetical protein n=1 Tax=Nocardiopsis dassonvillei TaxID=2014 RepID=UPI0020A28A03|nr:hypothetical protein [Nocardiopsis dassonvillei]MCP3011969.1 hypothetical protein [Nocardiopsis dassonvillei]